MKDSAGRNLFPRLSAFVKVVLTLSHGNAGPEQGFSINKSIIDAHGTRLGEGVIVALRRVKHRLLQVGGLTKFEVTRPLLKYVRESSSRYKEELKAKEEKARSLKKGEESRNENAIRNLESEIKTTELGIKVAEQAIIDGSSKMQAHLDAKNFDPMKIRADHSLIQMGLERNKKLTEDLSNLIMKKKAKLMKKSK